MAIPDLRRPWTPDDLLDLPDDGNRKAEPGRVHAVCEVWSPSTGVDDVREKTSLYAAAGIASYWRVEIEPTVAVGRPVEVELRLG